ncbi:hypothetical protein BVRB_6g135380 [Beta vulgaris subsp. vulgaris]|nr:hypothetical protein BVRB_6g135380 [Beta vulgaris subsp. vulgaris]
MKTKLSFTSHDYELSRINLIGASNLKEYVSRSIYVMNFRLCKSNSSSIRLNTIGYMLGSASISVEPSLVSFPLPFHPSHKLDLYFSPYFEYFK